LETRNDLLIPAEAYYELPTGIRFKSVGQVAPIFVSWKYNDPDTAFRLVNQSPIFWPTYSFTELLVQLWNPSHTSHAIPEGSIIAALHDGADTGVVFEEVDA